MSDGGAAAATSWITSVTDPDIKGYAENRGLDKMPLQDAFVAAAKAHRSAEAHLGVPENERLRIPRADDAAAVKGFWNRLGAGEKAEDYAFEGVTFGDQQLDDRFVKSFRDEALAMNMPKDLAERSLRWFQKNLADVHRVETDIAAGKLAEEKDALAKAWGANAEAHTFIAKQGAKRVAELMAKGGMSQADVTAAVSALEGQIGYRGVMEMFRTIGTGFGEAKYVAGGGPTGDQPMSPVQAQARLTELMSDREWGKRYMAGGADEKKQFNALTGIIASA